MKLKNLKLVLIYLGKVPEYVIQNANRLADLFNFEVYLFVSSIENIPGELSLHGRLYIRELTTIETADEEVFGHDAKFRDGFWLHTFNRLLQIKEIHRELGPADPILHIEADMLIMPSFPFEKVLANKLKWFRNSEVSDVASLVYYPNFIESEWMHSQLLKEARLDSMVTDMFALKRIRDRNPSRIEVFQDIFMTNLDQRIGIYDGASFGVWLCGVDPRNTFGLTVIHENGDYRVEGTKDLGELVSESDFYLEDGQIKMIRNDIVHSIHCLHIHSKDEKLLSINNIERIDRLLKFTKNPKPTVIHFDFETLIKLLRQNWEGGTLIAYIRNLLQFLRRQDKDENSRLYGLIKFILRWRSVK